MSIRKMSYDISRHLGLAEKTCKFLSASPDPFHAVGVGCIY
jgi:hypothetical protein